MDGSDHSLRALDHALFPAESTKVLDRRKELAAQKGIKIETVIADGDAATNITNYAKKRAATL